jgi:ketosteroid isomerase-like protein
MADTGNHETVEKFFEAVNNRDWGGVEGLLDLEYVWEMPQSGERVRGLENNRAQGRLPRDSPDYRQPGQMGHNAELHPPQDHRLR